MLLLVSLVFWGQLAHTSCAMKKVALSPLTGQERQELGTIGVVVERSGSEVWYSRPPFFADSGLREMLDNLHDSGQRDWEGDKQVKPFEERKGVKCHNEKCLLAVPLYILAAQIEKGGASGNSKAIDTKIYSNSLLMGLMQKSAIQVVQESINSDGTAERLRDEIWRAVQRHSTYQFELVKRLPDELPDMYGKRNEAHYQLLHDQGIATLLKIKIPLIEFRGSEPDGPYQLFVHVAMTLLQTKSGASIRRNTLVYRGGSLRVTEWNKDGAKLLIDGVSQGTSLIARRVTEALFE